MEYMNHEQIVEYASKLNQDDIGAIRKRMLSVIKYPHKWSKKVSIKKMAAYLVRVHPELYVRLDVWSTIKQTRPAGYRYYTGGGTRTYNGFRLKVWENKEDYLRSTGGWASLIDHNTTETYRQNYEVAQKIIEYEESKKES